MVEDGNYILGCSIQNKNTLKIKYQLPAVSNCVITFIRSLLNVKSIFYNVLHLLLSCQIKFYM